MTNPINRESIFEQLGQLFKDVFDNDSMTIQDSTTAKDVMDWDSLTHLQLIDAIERKFQIKFTTAEVASLSDVGQLVDTIVRKLETARP